MLASNDRFRNGLPKRLPDGFTLTKTNGDPSHYVVCEVWTHPVGWELRLTINGRILPMTTIVESADQMRSMVEAWKAVMVESRDAGEGLALMPCYCADGGTCEAHRYEPWPHDDCSRKAVQARWLLHSVFAQPGCSSKVSSPLGAPSCSRSGPCWRTPSNGDRPIEVAARLQRSGAEGKRDQ
jgi:hypothetical protein